MNFFPLDFWAFSAYKGRVTSVSFSASFLLSLSTSFFIPLHFPLPLPFLLHLVPSPFLYPRNYHLNLHDFALHLLPLHLHLSLFFPSFFVHLLLLLLLLPLPLHLGNIMGIIARIKSSYLFTHWSVGKYTKRRHSLAPEFGSRDAQWYEKHYKDGEYACPTPTKRSVSLYRRNPTIRSSEAYNETPDDIPSAV